MPNRTQLDILKDLFIAHQNKDEILYKEKAVEFIQRLRIKGLGKKADEFEKIISSKTIEDSFVSPIITEQLSLFTTKIQKTKSVKPSEEKIVIEKPVKETAWQVARGAEINLLQTQRLLENLLSTNKNSSSSEEIQNILGYSKEKARGFARLLYFMGLLEDRSRKPTALAKIINRYDNYFEDIGTVWLLHYYISSQPNLIIWNGIANELFLKPLFTYETAMDLFKDHRETHTEYAFKHHLKKEFNVCIHAYVESELKKLNILKLENKDEFKRLIPASVPDKILLAAILLYRHRFYPEHVAMEIKTLVHMPNSPGRLFYLKEYKFREALERLRISGYINIESFADLDQIKFIKTTDYLKCIETYYKDKMGEK